MCENYRLVRCRPRIRMMNLLRILDEFAFRGHHSANHTISTLPRFIQIQLFFFHVTIRKPTSAMFLSEKPHKLVCTNAQNRFVFLNFFRHFLVPFQAFYRFSVFFRISLAQRCSQELIEPLFCPWIRISILLK